MANKEDNLKVITNSDRARELQRLSAKKRSENIARRKTLKEALELILDDKAIDKDMLERFKKKGYNVEDVTNATLVTLALIEKAQRGDVNAFNSLRDTIGEKPKDTTELIGSVPVIINDNLKE